MDFLSAHEARLDGIADPEVLAIAAEQKRILVTHDFQTMPRHLADYLATGATSPGVLLVKQRTPIRQAIEGLILAWAASEPQDWQNRVMELLL